MKEHERELASETRFMKEYGWSGGGKGMSKLGIDQVLKVSAE